MSYSPDQIFHQLEKAAEARAKAEEEAHLLEQLGKILLSDLAERARLEGVPATACERMARTSPEWKEHVKGEAVAIGKRSQARAHYANLQILAAARQTQESTRRAEMGLR